MLHQSISRKSLKAIINLKRDVSIFLADIDPADYDSHGVKSFRKLVDMLIGARVLMSKEIDYTLGLDEEEDTSHAY